MVLVLSRKPGERISIGATASVELAGVDGARHAILTLVSIEELTVKSPNLRIDAKYPAKPGEPARAQIKLAVNQSVVVNGGVALMVVAVKGDRVRLGFTAARDTAILREEVKQSGRGLLVE